MTITLTEQEINLINLGLNNFSLSLDHMRNMPHITDTQKNEIVKQVGAINELLIKINAME